KIPDMIFDRNIDDNHRFLQRHTMALFRIEAVNGKAAKIAFGVANVGDCKLQIPRPAMVQHFSEQLPGAFLTGLHWPRRISRQHLCVGLVEGCCSCRVHEIKPERRSCYAPAGAVALVAARSLRRWAMVRKNS